MIVAAQDMANTVSNILARNRAGMSFVAWNGTPIAGKNERLLARTQKSIANQFVSLANACDERGFPWIAGGVFDFAQYVLFDAQSPRDRSRGKLQAVNHKVILAWRDLSHLAVQDSVIRENGHVFEKVL